MINWIKIKKGTFPVIDAKAVWVYRPGRVSLIARPAKYLCGADTNYWIEYGGIYTGREIAGVTHYRPIVRPKSPPEEKR